MCVSASASVKHGVMYCGQFQSKLTTSMRRRRSILLRSSGVGVSWSARAGCSRASKKVFPSYWLQEFAFAPAVSWTGADSEVDFTATATPYCTTPRPGAARFAMALWIASRAPCHCPCKAAVMQWGAIRSSNASRAFNSAA